MFPMNFLKRLRSGKMTDNGLTSVPEADGSRQDASKSNPSQPNPEIAPPPPYELQSPKEPTAPPLRHMSFMRYLPKSLVPNAPQAGSLQLRVFPVNHHNSQPRASTEEPAWVAQIELTTTNLPRLMREGLHWGNANINRGGGYMLDRSSDIPNWVFDIFPSHHRKYTTRVYSLLSLRENEVDCPAWTAELTVWGKGLNQIAPFRVSHLHPENVYFAQGWNEKNKPIYYFSKKYPERAFNCVYDDLPLGGWWPWPKAKRPMEALVDTF